MDYISVGGKKWSFSTIFLKTINLFKKAQRLKNGEKLSLVSSKAGFHSHSFPDSTSLMMRVSTLTTALIAQV
ncbi:MAG: hypothetical protein HDT44_06060 [Ruminococcaceae bacterium]|nr:hypothetical protein [Oscillospiraceae bacterium]